jgi:hypothetical protein
MPILWKPEAGAPAPLRRHWRLTVPHAQPSGFGTGKRQCHRLRVSLPCCHTPRPATLTGVDLVGSLKAPSDAALPIRFWQLYSVLGNDKIESIVKDFYSMVPTPKPPHPSPYTLHPTPYTLHPAPCSPKLNPQKLVPSPKTQSMKQ